MGALHNFVNAGNYMAIAKILGPGNAEKDVKEPTNPLVNSLDDLKRTPLHLAAYHGHAEIAKLLIRHGANVTAVADDSQHALHFAAQRGHESMCRLLIKNGAKVGVKSSRKWLTPLHVALKCKHANVANLLIQYGAGQKYSRDGELPLDMADEETLNELELLMGEENFKIFKARTMDKRKMFPPTPVFYRRKRTKKSKE